MHDWLLRNGLWGVGALMLLQNLLPVLPSEIIMPAAGFLASRGYMSLHAAILVGMAGSLLGHLPWYFLGRRAGEKGLEDFIARWGRWVGLKRAHVARADNWFDHHEARAVFLGRLLPGLRTYVNIPAGATRMAFLPFLLYTILGETLWDTGLAVGGYLLGRDYMLLSGWIHAIFVVPVALGFVAWLLFRHHRSSGPRARRPA